MKKNYIKDRSYIPVTLYVVIVLILILASCSVHKPLPGLCYTDKTGTYLCSDPETIDPIPEYDRNDTCRMIYGIDPEQWRLCMDPDNDHYYDPYWEQRQEYERQILPIKLISGDRVA